MHHDELWQLVDQAGERVMDGGYNSALGNPTKDPGLIYGITVVWIYRFTKDGIELLWQKRSATVDRNPDTWDVSAGGHVKYGEPFTEAALREAREEVGADLAREDLQLIEVGRRNNSTYWCYAANWTGRPDTFHFDDGEVSEVKWVPLSQVDEFRSQYSKKVLARDDRHFYVLKDWFENYGNL